MDRRAGADAYPVAVARLREGELVGVYPEATISRSFELKEFKTGAARMALDAQVPIIPLIVWGAQRIWTKDHPKNVGRNKIPITVAVDPPFEPSGTVDAGDGGAARGDERAAASSAGGLPAPAGRVLGATPARWQRADARRRPGRSKRPSSRSGPASRSETS